MDDPRTNLGGAASRDFDARLRRARLGMGVAVAGIVMIFVSFTSAYVVRQGLPTIDPRTGTLVRDWIPVRLPALLLVNTCVLLLSSLTMALARRQVSGEVAVARATSVSKFRPPRDRKFRGWR